MSPLISFYLPKQTILQLHAKCFLRLSHGSLKDFLENIIFDNLEQMFKWCADFFSKNKHIHSNYWLALSACPEVLQCPFSHHSKSVLWWEGCSQGA